jgi:hypothetical protein
MVNPLNLYATKVFAEHPVTLWALDEEVGYLSLISEADRDLSTWTVAGADLVDISSFQEPTSAQPFPNSSITGLLEQEDNLGIISLKSNFSINESVINKDLGSFAIGFYAYSLNRSFQARIGFTYINPENEEEYEVIRSVNVPAQPRRGWSFVSETFALPQNFTDLSLSIEIDYVKNDIPYEIAINGISFGQWSEEFSTTSLGAVPIDLPSNIPITSKAIEAKPYGLQGSSGYYLINDNNLCAKNTGMPLVIGSRNSTVITPNDSNPSIILPGNGFMNERGKFSSATFEFWTSIQSNAVLDKRIFGPISSTDGVYVDRHLLKLKVGEKTGSYPVGEWARPMLISIRLTDRNASMLLNGEEVISLSFLDGELYFPEETGEDGKSQDWLGFYAYEDVPMLQVESVAIYSYEVPALVQKRRFVYGQGVDFPTSITGMNHSSTVAVDYSVANYAKNVRYPATNRWSAAHSENMLTTKTHLSLPSYKVPSLFLNNNRLDWSDASYENFDENSPFFALKYDETWSDTDGYLYFENIGFLKESPVSIYGVFETVESNAQPQTLLRFVNSNEGTALDISIQSGTIRYTIEFINNSLEKESEVFYECSGNSVGDVFAVGIDFASASRNFGSRVSAFLGTMQSSKMFIGGNSDYTNTFSGKIYRIAISSKNNLEKMQNVFSSNGLALDYHNGNIASNSNKLTQTATYTLVATRLINSFELDVATESYWEDYAPLSYFGKYVVDSKQEQFFSLDFLQFNIDYVRLQNFVDGNYNTEKMPVKTYISFQYLKNGANQNILYFTNTQPLPKDGVIRPTDEWINTKYEVLNDTIIKLPQGINVKNVAIVFHIEIVSGGVINDNIKIKFLEIASQALGYSPNKIKTKFGAEVIPYKKSGLYFDYKSVSPFSIYKQSSPYLYLTKHSGIKSRAPWSFLGNDGLSLPINKNSASFFKVDAIQMVLRYEETSFPISPVQVFEIQSATDYIKFYLVADSNTQRRGQIYAIDSNTGRLRSDIVYYIDGKVVKRPILNLNTWFTLGVSFTNTISFENATGALRFTSPIMFNNVSYYQTTQLNEVQRFAYRKWSAVRAGLDETIDWGSWDDVTWQEVLFLAETTPEITDLSDIYGIYTGTNSFIFDSSSDLVINNYSSSVYKDLSWTSSVITPV